MKLIIFDVDGTLIDSQETIFRVFEKVLQLHKLSVPDKSIILSSVGLSLPEAVRSIYPNLSDKSILKLTKSLKDAFVEIRNTSDGLELSKPFPNTLITLETLKKRSDLMLSIATGKPLADLNCDLRSHKLLSYFGNLQTSDNHPSKPDPSMLRAALADTGVPFSSAVMVGDTTFDITMAKSLNIKTIGVTWGYHSATSLIEAGADFLVSAMSELELTIDKAFRRDIK